MRFLSYSSCSTVDTACDCAYSLDAPGSRGSRVYVPNCFNTCDTHGRYGQIQGEACHPPWKRVVFEELNNR